MKKLIVMFSAALILTACGSDKKSPGKIYMPDMTYSNAYETYSGSDIKTPEGFGMSARLPVSGSIPRGFVPADAKIRNNEAYLMSYMAKKHFTGTAENWQAEYDKAALVLANPVEATEANLAAGKKAYEINCKVCHGEKGEGNGQIVELPDGGDGPFTARPPAFAARLKEIKDGNMFYVVSYGKGAMGGYGSQISVTERWQIINYIKKMAGVGEASTPAAAPAAPAAPAAESKK